jgi:hypothetical protein
VLPIYLLDCSFFFRIANLKLTVMNRNCSCILAFLLVSCIVNQGVLSHSGFYLPNTEFAMESYSASWLISKLKFFNSQKHFELAVKLEQVSLFIVSRTMNKKVFPLMSRDYLDLHVEHLSSTTNFVNSNSLLSALIPKAERKLVALRNNANSNTSQNNDIRASHETLALIPFHLTRVQKRRHVDVDTDRELRMLFFMETFWSVYRYFRHVAVGVSSAEDYDLVKGMNLPIFRIIDLSGDFYFENLNIVKTVLLPKYFLLRVLAIMQSGNADWEQFRYFYYTESDQILYAREISRVFDVIDESKAHVVIVPHRMQVHIYKKKSLYSHFVNI